MAVAPSKRPVKTGRPERSQKHRQPAPAGAGQLCVLEHQANQRLDNYLAGRLKGAPKTLIYRIIRTGEVRINGKRAKADSRVQPGDLVRVPPLRLGEQAGPPAPGQQLTSLLKASVLLEDADFLVINKPAGLAVHAGSGSKLGLIEALRQIFPQWPGLELVHRLDKGTSGCLLLAKTGKARKALMQAFRDQQVRKTYHAIVVGQWPSRAKRVDVALLRQPERSGQRRVEIDDEGKEAVTEFSIAESLRGATLVEARPLTGRTHQIRVHAAWVGCELLGDDKYASRDQEALRQRAGHKRLFLHAGSLTFPHPSSGLPVLVQAPYDTAFDAALRKLRG